jgi:hypothetical protein
MIIDGSTGLEFPDGSDQGTAFTGNAATITSGTLAAARLPSSGINAASITVGTLPSTQLPSSGVNAASITTGILAVANGGTSVSTSTGSGSVVLSTSPTLVTPVLGTPTSGNLNNCTADGTNRVGYRNVPPSGTRTSSYTLTLADVGEYVQVGSGGSITIPNAIFSEGDVISIFNNTTGGITITCSITTSYIAGTDSDKNTMTLATRGVATILFISGTVCVVTGNVS